MSLIRLPYLGNNSLVTMNETPVGYTEISGLDDYSGVRVRNVYIVRVDLLKYLTEYFSMESLSIYRSAIYYIISGKGMNTNKELIVKTLEYLYVNDDSFKLKLGKLVYFRDTHLEGLSVYSALLEDIKLNIKHIENKILGSIPHRKYICNSMLYYYFSIDNEISRETIKNILGVEVVSR